MSYCNGWPGTTIPIPASDFNPCEVKYNRVDKIVFDFNKEPYGQLIYVMSDGTEKFKILPFDDLNTIYGILNKARL